MAFCLPTMTFCWQLVKQQALETCRLGQPGVVVLSHAIQLVANVLTMLYACTVHHLTHTYIQYMQSCLERYIRVNNLWQVCLYDKASQTCPKSPYDKYCVCLYCICSAGLQGIHHTSFYITHVILSLEPTIHCLPVGSQLHAAFCLHLTRLQTHSPFFPGDLSLSLGQHLIWK